MTDSEPLVQAALVATLTNRKTKYMKIEIAQNPSYPRFSVLVDGLWDCDCASNSESETLAAAAEKYPDCEILGWNHPDHYWHA